MGRVTAHEIGHSLSLRHAWGNGWGCTDNLVSDIPTQNGPNYNCPDTTFSLCHSDTTRDIVKHYMDYCGDSCMVMFTKGQVYNARKSIQQYRMDLIDTIQFPNTNIDQIITNKVIKIYPLDENNNEFILVSHGVGKFGRCLGELFITSDSDSINNQLVLEGHAKKYNGGKR